MNEKFFSCDAARAEDEMSLKNSWENFLSDLRAED
jgi:hypothetical protein